MKNIGIWIDKEKAHIVTLEEDTEKFKTIFSELEFYNPKGGSRSKTRWGPQDVVQDSKYTEREKHQIKAYFNRISKELKGADAIAIFGPSDTNEKLSKELKKNHRALSKKVLKVFKADSMTDNQVKALVREIYGGGRP